MAFQPRHRWIISKLRWAFGLDSEEVEVLRRLGAGHEGTTYLVRRLKVASNPLQAAKMLRRGPMLDAEFLHREILTQSRLRHDFIVGLHEVMLTPSHVVIFMQYAEGGDFFSYIVAQKSSQAGKNGGLVLGESEARWFFRQLVLAIAYCHSKRVAHRDIKLANVLLQKRENSNHLPPLIKVCDFGMSKQWQRWEEASTHTTCGTPAYMPPEVLEQMVADVGYDPRAADVWSCGVFLYVLLLGKFPFSQGVRGKAEFETHYRSMLEQIYLLHAGNSTAMMAEVWGDAQLSEACKDLLNGMLAVSSSDRLTVAEVMGHRWYREGLELLGGGAMARRRHCWGPSWSRGCLTGTKMRRKWNFKGNFAVRSRRGAGGNSNRRSTNRSFCAWCGRPSWCATGPPTRSTGGRRGKTFWGGG